jgi:predicted O-methyltransferase YrrM
MKNVTPPNRETVTSSYSSQLDKLLGRTKLEWTCDDGHRESLTANLRFTDYQGFTPSFYSLAKLPYVLQTYMQAKKQPLMKNPVPFIVMDAIRYLDKLVRPGMRVLEVGGGNSSLWFLSKDVHLTTFEHNSEWAGYMMEAIKANPVKYPSQRFNLNVMQGQETVNTILAMEDKSYDIILIDSMNDYTRRNACIEAALTKVKKGGWIVLDNSDNPVNWNGRDLLAGKEMRRFTGFAPMALFVCQTTFWKI